MQAKKNIFALCCLIIIVVSLLEKERLILIGMVLMKENLPTLEKRRNKSQFLDNMSDNLCHAFEHLHDAHMSDNYQTRANI